MPTTRLVGALPLCLWVIACGVPESHREAQRLSRTYLVVYRPGPAWVPDKPLAEQSLKQHRQYILSLYARGALRLAGPFLDNTGGAAALEAANEDEARALMAADPAVLSGVFVTELHPWGLLDWKQIDGESRVRE